MNFDQMHRTVACAFFAFVLVACGGGGGSGSSGGGEEAIIPPPSPPPPPPPPPPPADEDGEEEEEPENEEQEEGTEGEEGPGEIPEEETGEANRPPVIVSRTSFAFNENTFVGIVLYADDPDGDEITYSLSNTGDGRWFRLDPQTRIVEARTRYSAFEPRR